MTKIVYVCMTVKTKIVSLLSTFRWILLFNLLSIFYPGSCTLLKRFAKNEIKKQTKTKKKK